jgi:MoaA/NifB/PqqE/SkfB family radical SAM enzyme
MNWQDAAGELLVDRDAKIAPMFGRLLFNARSARSREKGRRMAIGQSVKRRMVSATARSLIAIAARASDRNLVRLTYALQRVLPKIDFYQNGLVTIRRMFEEGHQGMNAVRRVLTEPSRAAVRHLINNMIVGNLVEGYRRRYVFWEKYGIAPPATVLFSPTMRCNLNCAGCYAGEYSRDEELDRATADRIIAESQEIGINVFTILGGEPFLWPRLPELFEDHPEAAFQVFTNGSLLDEAMIKRLAKAANALVVLAIEGWRETTERRRGPGSFDRVLALMDLMRHERMMIAYSVTVTRENVDEVTDPAFVRLMLDHGAHLGWYFHYQPTGRCAAMDSLPMPEQRETMRVRLRQARRTMPILIVDFLNDGALTEGCMSAGRRYIHINHRGEVEPCIFVHFATDNIHEKPLAEALCSDFFRDLRRNMPFNANHLRPCMILDNPQHLRDAVARCQPRLTHPDADAFLTRLAPEIDEYSARYAALTDARSRSSD